MKKVITVLLGVALYIPAIAFAQSSAQQNDKAKEQQQNQAAEMNENGSTTTPQHKMTGMVSNGGHMFTNGDTSYTVNNPNSLKQYENQTVAVVFQFNPNNNNTIHIISVTPAQPPQ